LDYQITYRIDSHVGVFVPSLSATETDHYTSALTPSAPATNRVSIANDDGNFAPRWKGAATIAWSLGPYSARVGGRYVGRYQDYDVTTEIGNFWLCDANFRYSLTLHSQSLPNTAFVEIGGVNVFNRLPQYSNFQGGAFGYDPTQADIRGRFLYAQLGVKW
jgi:iron complex outermembrane recepter protein